MTPVWSRRKPAPPPVSPPGPPPAPTSPPGPRVAAFDVKGPWPRFESPYGGLWVDLSNAHELVDGKLEIGHVDEEEARELHSFIDEGFVVLPGAVSPEILDGIEADVARAKKGELEHAFVEHWTGGKLSVEKSTKEVWALPPTVPKLVDLHADSEAARRAEFAPAIRRFLDLVFERPAMVFQSLQFTYGTEQAIHQDTAYVIVESPRELVASWIALEDVSPDSGELEYYVGSHRLDDFLWRGRYKAKPSDMAVEDPEHIGFLQHLHDASQAKGFVRRKFRPKRGDALIWHADLAHGGSKIVDHAVTRRSFVSHYCPVGLAPGYFDYMKNSGKLPRGDGSYYAYAIR